MGGVHEDGWVEGPFHENVIRSSIFRFKQSLPVLIDLLREYPLIGSQEILCSRQASKQSLYVPNMEALGSANRDFRDLQIEYSARGDLELVVKSVAVVPGIVEALAD